MTDNLTLDQFNSLPVDQVRDALASCLAVPRWVDEVLALRPYDQVDNAMAAARSVAATLTTEEVELALSRHPRIGERPGDGHDRAFSQAEQAGVDRSDTAVAEALAVGNAAYEERFDRVFLIRAAGRSSAEILAELQRRLTNSDEDERAEVVSQLGEIALLRLEQVITK